MSRGAVVVAALLSGCRTPTGPDITIFNNITNTGQAPGSTTPPTPTEGGSLPEGSRIRIGVFGQECPPGVVPPQNGLGQIKLGCLARITATPKYLDGTDIPSTIHGSAIFWVYLSGNGVQADCRPDPSNDFNRFCAGRSPGTLILQATVKNVSGIGEFQVIP